MRADVFERDDAVRLTGDKRVRRDRHDARHGFAFTVERLELHGRPSCPADLDVLFKVGYVILLFSQTSRTVTDAADR